MKKPSVMVKKGTIVLLMVLMSVCMISCGQSTTENAEEGSPTAVEQETASPPETFSEDDIQYDDENMALAYFTKDGDTYHLFRNCPQIKDVNVMQTRMSELAQRGYEPCSECSKTFVEMYD